MIRDRAKSMGFVALLALASATDVAVEHHHDVMSMATVLSQASELMTSGVGAFIKETKNSRSERKAHALVDGAQSSDPALDDMEKKALEMASQVFTNLERLSKAAKKLETVASKEDHSHAAQSHNRQASAAVWEGRTEKMKEEIDGLRETNHELEDEKRSLISSVQQMLHGSKEAELKDCHTKVGEGLESVKAAKAEGEKVADQLRKDNDALTETLQKCQSAEAQAAAAVTSSESSNQASTMMDNVKCETKLQDAYQKMSSSTDEQNHLSATVTLLMRENEKLKADLEAAKKGQSASPSPAPAQGWIKAQDVAHMGDTTRMDMYIAQSEGELTAVAKVKALEGAAAPPAPKKAEAKRVAAVPTKSQPSKKAVEKKVAEKKQEKPVRIIKLNAKAMKAATSAVNGNGAIGRYLMGDATPRAPPAAAPAAHNSTKSLDDALAQLETADASDMKDADTKVTEEADDGDDLARRLLLQAEHNLKLAA
jgi:hypothetical protein